MQNAVATLEELSSFLQNKLLRHDPAIGLLGADPKELKMYIHTKTYTRMFTLATLALSIIAETWESPRYPFDR